MKILAIAPQPFFSPRGTPFSVYYRTLVKAELGHQVDLLTYGQGQDVDLPGVNIIRIPAFKALGDIKIGPSWPKLFLDVFIMFWVIALLLRNRYDLVHAHEEAVFMCLLLKPLFRFKLIYDMHSSLPQQLENFNFTKSTLLTGLFAFLEAWALNSAQAVITICPDLYCYARERAAKPDHVMLIENSIFDPVRLKREAQDRRTGAEVVDEHEDVITRWKNQAHPIVVYAGTLEPYQGIGILIRAFREVLQKMPAARLLIVGGNPAQVEEYSQLARSINIEAAARFTGRVPQEAAQRFTQAAHVQVSPRSRGTNTPLKIYAQLASGIPLVATNIYSHTQALDDRVAFLVEPDPNDMAEGIIKAITSESLRESKTLAARTLYNAKYARPVYERKLASILTSLAPA